LFLFKILNGLIKILNPVLQRFTRIGAKKKRGLGRRAFLPPLLKATIRSRRQMGWACFGIWIAGKIVLCLLKSKRSALPPALPVKRESKSSKDGKALSALFQ